MSGVLAENRALHQPFSFGKIDEQNAHNCTLALHFHSDKVIYNVESLHGNVMAYGLCHFDSAGLHLNSVQQLEEALPIFKYKFRKVWAAVSNNQYCLIPTEVHKRQFNDQYLSFSLGKDASTFSLIKQDNLFTIDLVMVYNVNARLEQLLTTAHSGASVRHEKSVIASRGLAMAEDDTNVLMINLCEGHFDLTLIHSRKLIFLNSFPMNNTEEILYYVFDVLKQLELNISDFIPRIIGLKPTFFNRELIKKYIPGIKEYRFQNGDIYNDSGLYFTVHYLTR